MANAGVNNVPAAGKWGAAPAMASVEGEAQSPPPSSGYIVGVGGVSDRHRGRGWIGCGASAPAAVLPAEAAAAAAVWSLSFRSASEWGMDPRKGMEDTISLRPGR